MLKFTDANGRPAYMRANVVKVILAAIHMPPGATIGKPVGSLLMIEGAAEPFHVKEMPAHVAEMVEAASPQPATSMLIGLTDGLKN